MSTSKKILIVLILLLITSFYFLSKTKEVKVVSKFFRALTFGGDNFSSSDPEAVQNLRYPKVLTKNGLRPEIENELYTGDREKECRKTQEGKCIPEADSAISDFLSNVKKEDQVLAEKFFLMEKAAQQEFLKDLSISEIERVLRMEDISRTCQRILSKDRNKFFDNRSIRREIHKIEHSDEFVVRLEAERKVIKVNYNKISSDAKSKYRTKETCNGYFSENSN